MTLTTPALQQARNRVVSPMIIQAKDGSFPSVRARVKQLDLFEQARAEAREEISNIIDPEVARQSVLDDVRPGVLFGKETPSVDAFGALGPIQRRELPQFNMIASFLGRDAIFDLAEETGVETIYPDQIQYALFNTVPDDRIFSISTSSGKFKFTDTRSTLEMTGVTRVQNMGYRGEGETVTVPDTAGKHVHPQTDGQTFTSTMTQQTDQNGHGVWCSACVFGSTRLNTDLSEKVDGQVIDRGIAPAANGKGIKCLGWVVGAGSTSDILKAIEVSINDRAGVMSMSLGGPAEAKDPTQDPYYDPMQLYVDQGGIPVVAAGNSGPEKNTIGSPGHLPNVLTVGAFDPRDGEIAEFSSRGPTNDGRTLPDVVAPGVKTDSGAVGLLEGASDQAITRSAPISGTSMATPHAAGMIVLMRQIYRENLDQQLTLEEVKTMMRELGDKKDNTSGWGAINFDIIETWLETEYNLVLGEGFVQPEQPEGGDGGGDDEEEGPVFGGDGDGGDGGGGDGGSGDGGGGDGGGSGQDGGGGDGGDDDANVVF